MCNARLEMYGVDGSLNVAAYGSVINDILQMLHYLNVTQCGAAEAARLVDTGVSERAVQAGGGGSR